MLYTIVRARTDNPNHFFWGSRKYEGIFTSNFPDSTGASNPTCTASHKFPASVVISISAGVYLPSALSFASKTPALSVTNFTEIPVSFDKFFNPC